MKGGYEFMLRWAVKTVAGRSPTVAKYGSILRARLQERTASHSRWRIEREAASRGVVALSPEDTLAALRIRLADRALMNRWPRRKGDLHIFVAFSLFHWEEVLFKAFDPFGEVTVFEWSAEGFDPDAADGFERRPLMNKAMLEAFEAAHARRPVDAVVGYLSGHNTEPSTLAKMAETGAAIFNFSYDDKLDDGPAMPDGLPCGPAGLAANVDLNLTSVPDAILKYRVHGGLGLFHPEAAEPRIHRPYPVTFKYDVTFVGARYGFRPFFIERLHQMGIDVHPFGRDWPSGTLKAEQMVELYSLSRINLGFGGIGHSRELMCLKGRDFEVPMSGGLYLTQDNPELQLVFDVGAEIVTYTDEADCAAKIRALLADPERAAAIRRAGRMRCLRDHTYEARWSRVFEAAGIMVAE